jgi:hypothetical protein
LASSVVSSTAVGQVYRPSVNVFDLADLDAGGSTA